MRQFFGASLFAGKEGVKSTPELTRSKDRTPELENGHKRLGYERGNPQDFYVADITLLAEDRNFQKSIKREVKRCVRF